VNAYFVRRPGTLVRRAMVYGIREARNRSWRALMGVVLIVGFGTVLVELSR